MSHVFKRILPGLRAKRLGAPALPPPDLKRLLYSSVAIMPLTPDELARVRADTHARHRAAGLTGLLVHHRGRFTGCLEGPADAVLAAFADISAHPLHFRVEVQAYQPVQRRAYAAWAMVCGQLGASWLQLSRAQWQLNRLAHPFATRRFRLVERVREITHPDSLAWANKLRGRGMRGVA